MTRREVHLHPTILIDGKSIHVYDRFLINRINDLEWEILRISDDIEGFQENPSPNPGDAQILDWLYDELDHLREELRVLLDQQ
jgi:hypothetical protein